MGTLGTAAVLRKIMARTLFGFDIERRPAI
jgi:hypothetical protein